MNNDAGLVASLVERLTTRLPHLTGGNLSSEPKHDEIASITRAGIVKLSPNSIALILNSLVTLLEEVVRFYNFASHPQYVRQSEVYIVALAADCCTVHWEAIRKASRDASPGSPANPTLAPKPIDDNLVKRVLSHLRLLIEPIPDGYVIPTKAMLEDDYAREILDPRYEDPPRSVASSSGSESARDTPTTRERERFEGADEIEPYVKKIVEFLSAANWSVSFDYVRHALHHKRTTTPSHANSAQTMSLSEEDRNLLVIIKMLQYLWVDSNKLGLVMQDLSSTFLHFRRIYQNTVALVAPILIFKWIERFPREFVRLHSQRRRLDGGPDALADMAHSLGDNGRRRSSLYPFQTTLLMLVPEVFEVASNLRDVKGGNMTKRVAFLEGLRKGLRNKNETAGVCLVLLVRAARHFGADTETAFSSFVMDIQDELKDAVFRRHHTIGECIFFEQDLTTAALISLIHINMDVYVDPLVQICAQHSAPLPFKVAIMQTCSYFARSEIPQNYHRLYVAVAGFIQQQLRALSAVSTDLYIGARRSRRKVSVSDARTNNEIVTCHILKFLAASPLSLFESVSPEAKNSDSFYEEIYKSFVSCLVTANDTVRGLSTPVAQSILPTNGLLASVRQATPLDSNDFKLRFWKLTASVLSDMCDKYYEQDDVLFLKSIQKYLETGLLLLSSCRELCRLDEDFPERTAIAIKVESLLLVALCAPELDTCQIVTYTLGLLNEECLILLSESQEANVATLQLPNYDIYAEIASREFRFTGMMAFQKRTRALLRRITFPAPSVLDAWERAYDTWNHLSDDLSTTYTAKDDKSFVEWRNLTGFLASLGGVCTAEQSFALLEDPMFAGMRWIDRVAADDSETPILHAYLQRSTALLSSSNGLVRETIRDVLSTEISPTLYLPLFKAIEAELNRIFDEARENCDRNHDRYIIFAAEATSLLRNLVDKLESSPEYAAAAAVNFSALGLDFVKFLDGAAETPATLRLKTRFCQLYESVTKKKEHLNFRDDVRKRNLLLEYIFSWIARPRSPRTEHSYGSGRRDEEAMEAQKDLDKACFRCLANLTYRLPLQPGEGQSDAGTSELKSQMFHTYFNRFLSLLNHESAENMERDVQSQDESRSTSALAITILSNLLSANIDVGLKYSLSIGYHENIEIRTAFVMVLYNILVQGTEFSTLSDKAINEKYSALLELLTQDMSLVVAIAAACPSSEVEELTVSLLNIFESRGMTFELMEALIKQEIDDTENEAEILRRNCVATKLLSVYAKWKGANYLKATLQKVLEKLMLTSQDLDLELDPSRLASQEELERHAKQLRIVAKVFIDDICSSSVNIPPSFRKICSIISAAVMPRFPEARYTAVGAFIFLRFFCPAIVSPESEKLVTESPSKELRRGLLLIAKIIQNLANNVLFGAKEPYMSPLNDFLSQNIYNVTTFLREISVPPDNLDLSRPEIESFDFGSCVVLHRFLYEQWDNVRRRLIQERKEQIRTPNELTRSRPPVHEPLRILINTLGPPSLAITWNRPQVSANLFTTYSRFQHFMLRNAFRDSSSYMGNRIIYDGGETKDGLALICIVLRNVDQDTVDADTLLFAFFKLASRLWHKPYGILVDSTCDNLTTEYQDELMRKFELLVPSEAMASQTRLYIYNMNSMKTLRRNLRMFKDVFEKSNTEIHLIATTQDLHNHFNDSEIPLPKETLDIAADARYTFQSVTRLSKTKGKIEVTIKVGNQYVQVTTLRKHEVHPGHGLSTILNDIFRLGDIDEAPTSISTEDSAFGLRADNGKIVMYFLSPRKDEILQAIRSAKAKYAKDTRIMKPGERFIRPQDIPGTLLNLALINLAASDQALRVASYNLLGALCQAFKFQAASKFVCINDVHIPLAANQFIVDISTTLAHEEPQLTADFLNEFFVGWDNFTCEQKPLSLAYMAPWLQSLRTAFLGDESDCDVGKERIANIFQKLIDATSSDSYLFLALERLVWPAIYKDEILLDIFVEVIMKSALAVGPNDEHIKVLTAIVLAMGTITLRGRIISRLRKALNRSVVRPTRYLYENVVWDEIVILLHFCLALSFDCGVQAQLYMPEIFHIVTMLANSGTADVRSSVQRLLINSLHAACTSFRLDEQKSSKLCAILDKVSDPKNDALFVPAGSVREGMPVNAVHDGSQGLAATEQLSILLFDTCTVAAPSVDLANAWRSRWMSLVASTAFQNNPAIQPRAFTVMGCLAREEIDDDLLYQVLVALRHSITRFAENGSTDMLVSVVSSLSKMIVKLTSASRYALQLFWLAVSLIRLMPTPRLFNCATHLLEAVLTNIGISNELRSEKTAAFLLQGRSTLEKATLPLDDVYGVHFTPDNFHFAVCACLVRGLTDPVTKPTTLRVVSTFLELTTGYLSASAVKASPDVFYQSPYMTLIQSRLVDPEQVEECLWSANVDPAILANLSLDRDVHHLENISDRDLLLHIAIQLVDFPGLEPDLQTNNLTWLNDLALARPAAMVNLYPSISSLLNRILVHAQKPETLKAAHNLLQIMTVNSTVAISRERQSVLVDMLQDMGFEGLWRTSSFLQAPDFDKQLIGLTGKLIELIII
ncbi:GTPase [Xylaria nigripes]|nr:GTPase [Xylaria nigripes]